MAGSTFSAVSIDLIALDTPDFIWVKLFYIPDEVPDQYTPNYQSVDVMGRGAPIMAWTGGGPRTVSLDLAFHERLADVIWGPRTTPLPEDYVVQEVNKMRSFQFPVYDVKSGRLKKPPTRVLVRAGGFLRFVAVLTDCSVVWKGPYGSTGQPRNASVSTTWTQVIDQPFSAEEVLRGADTYDCPTNILTEDKVWQYE